MIFELAEKSVCYYFAQIPVSKINPRICTHLLFGFFGLDTNGNINYLDYSESQVTSYLTQMVALKTQNPALKVMVAIGGWNEGLYAAWYETAEDPVKRKNFAEDSLRITKKFNLDGVDIDWEFPNHDGTRPQDKQNFVSLLQDLKRVMGNYLVTCAISAGQWTSQSYDWPGVFNAVDSVNLMSYDLYGNWSGKTGIHTALYSSPRDPSDQNVNAAVKVVLNSGVDKNKLIMGIGTYGNAFRLNDPNNNGVGAPAVGNGSLTYYQICSAVKDGQLNYKWDDDQKSPYAYADTLWVGYDDIRAVTEKAKYINSMGLGGAMFWAVDNDDYDNICGDGRYPLISKVYSMVVGRNQFENMANLEPIISGIQNLIPKKSKNCHSCPKKI